MGIVAEKKISRIRMVDRVYLIITLFITLIGILVMFIQMEMNVLNAVRAYIGAEGLWAKAQKDATRSLEHYALFHNEADYKFFLRYIRVPLGDSRARNELDKPNPNLVIVREGLLEGGVNPQDLESMINLYRRFQHSTYFAEAIQNWTLGDHLIDELNGQGKIFHEEILSGNDKPETTRALLGRLDTLNYRLTDQENEFSVTMAKASRWVSRRSNQIAYGFAILFAMLGLSVSWPIITRIRITENKLLSNEADLRIAATAFESQDSLMITDANSVVLQVNQSFINQTGYTFKQIVGQTPQLLKSNRHNEGFYRAMWAAIHLNGKWEGEIWGRRKNGEEYLKWLSISAVKSNDGVVTHYVSSHIDITERKAAENAIRNLAFYDPLTHLPNRRLLMDRLQQALLSKTSSGRKGAVMFIDLDHFKVLNDSLGHDIGDLLLQQAANRLIMCVRPGDTVARLGGDEFVVVLENLSEDFQEAVTQTEVIGDAILDSLRQPYQLAQIEYLNTISVGVTLFSDGPQVMGDLMKQADIAMYQAKHNGRNTMCFFDPGMLR